MVDLRFCTREVGTVLEDDEVHVAIARREILRGRRASGVHDRWMGLLQRLRLAPDRDGVEALALEIELFVLRPCPPHELEPLGGVFVTIIVRTHLRAEHVEFVLEPSANHVHGEPAVSDVIDRGRHLGHHQWMYQRHMHGGEYGAIVRHRADRGGPGEAFECAIVEVRWAAVAFPAPHRQQGLHSRTVDRLRDVLGVGPVELPRFRDGGDGGSVAAIESHDPELHAIAAEQTSAGRVVLSRRGGVHVRSSRFIEGQVRTIPTRARHSLYHFIGHSW